MRSAINRAKKTGDGVLYVLVALPNGKCANFSCRVPMKELHEVTASQMMARNFEPGYSAIASILKFRWVDAPMREMKKLMRKKK
jgi:hypothetical protein